MSEDNSCEEEDCGIHVYLGEPLYEDDSCEEEDCGIHVYLGEPLYEDDSCEEEDCGIHAYLGEPSCLRMTLVKKKIVAPMLTWVSLLV